jgi:hypothetical protein
VVCRARFKSGSASFRRKLLLFELNGLTHSESANLVPGVHEYRAGFYFSRMADTAAYCWVWLSVM